ncbi:S-ADENOSYLMETHIONINE SYNTHETASE (METHIONINE ADENOSYLTRANSFERASE) (ADOMET SYNTHETASE) [Mycoplasmopsis pulmonis]|uniref:S-adenosylmethionine synthase n=1 Tax=Mycoplasmopsis pulmonis (strain UAB CTIP) TaxID=272635 RepID=METK_MYCPU|nr:methionine adenosyltransferase [Mycoplasmopsis pulmonis]Q98PM0.1 RecName: Full=S-adenosylmethionine synthase; Short=AdoMet synthase; AltName: Full=MAT; AltName: Full=Methionine adenosyltransferase [Mycoplasmopsis pulmonis UAB CTIP]MDZ7293445.1 methionine adenosyltransferase [Mycoplasmopsis pulmonis]CAC13875.1 S-ADENOSYLMETHIONINE SYNTHETASE (METHIONINE ADENOSYLTRANSFERASE) (ADOMET SYNTHETASE) [Mycoplasmopsis pulmonis]VEU68468.1 S-adenosylmethionine synthase [Mycoplasmopsis pulmonis]
MQKNLFTSESVGRGHPDKICDQISDSILDAVLKIDPNSRCAIEVMASNRLIIIGGEITTQGYVDLVSKSWEILISLGYTENDFTIISNVNEQSKEIANQVDRQDDNIGAGDQGIMFGFASDETKSFMPLAISIAHDLVKRAEKLRVENKINGLKSDMKSQVTIDYSDQKNPKIDTILMSLQHDKDVLLDNFRNDVKKLIIEPVVNDYNLNSNYKCFINPNGSFSIGGPIGDTGLTGRKIIVDTYGGAAHHGGGAFSGKDYTKVDRSAAYMARYIAKNLVAAKVAKKLEIQLSYGIGMIEPISINVNSFGTSKFSDLEITDFIRNNFSLSPKSIIEKLNLKNTKYFPTSFFGHFGRDDLDLPWEKLDQVDKIKKFFK